MFITNGTISPDVCSVTLFISSCLNVGTVSKLVTGRTIFYYLFYVCSNLNFSILGRPAWLAGSIWPLELSVRAWNVNCTANEPLNLYYFTAYFQPIQRLMILGDGVGTTDHGQ